jgi:hypothetical protein
MAHGNTSKEPNKIQINPLLFIKYLIVIDKEKKKTTSHHSGTSSPGSLISEFKTYFRGPTPHTFIYLFIFTPIHLLHAYKSLPSYTSLWRPLSLSLSDFFSFF